MRSWRKLIPHCEIIIFGDEAGIAEVAEEVGAIHISEIRKNEFGTPYLDGIFSQVQGMAKNDILCYSNTDIIFLNDFPAGVGRINDERFLLVGQRMDLDLTTEIDFSGKYEEELRGMTATAGKLHDVDGMDYFVFRKGTLNALPAFLVGRAGWDNWMIYNARDKGIKVIDGTNGYMVIHQNHNYGHVKKGVFLWLGPESDYNLALLGGIQYRFTLYDATYRFDGIKVRPNLSAISIYRRMKSISILKPEAGRVFHVLEKTLYPFEEILLDIWRNKKRSE
ncbi:MAG TPA: hypothetical protein VGK23_03560 [Methanomassiliicoccales archaeon]